MFYSILVCACNACCCELMYYLFQIEETDEARKKFSNAKSISSSQFFGDQNKDADSQVSLQKFSVSAIFGDNNDINFCGISSSVVTNEY